MRDLFLDFGGVLIFFRYSLNLGIFNHIHLISNERLLQREVETFLIINLKLHNMRVKIL